MTAGLRILFLGDGEWASTSVRRLHQEGHRIVGVVLRTRPTSSCLAEAAAAVEAPVFQPPDASAPDFVAQVAAVSPDLALSVAYDRILRRPLLTLPPAGCVNFHAGKLPEYRGRNVLNWALINGEEEIGITAHHMDDGIDSGPILLQRTLPIAWTDTYADVLRNVVRAMPDLVAATVDGLADGRLVAEPQPAGAGTYYGGRIPGDEWLDWTQSSRDLYNKIRGITRPGPGARTLLGHESVVVWRAEYDPAWPRYRATPGEVVGRCASGGSVVKTGDSTLLVHEVQVGEASAGPPGWRLGTRLGLNSGAALTNLVARLADLERRLEEGRHA
jgi:methionyl-tRNA formyltransferase